MWAATRTIRSSSPPLWADWPVPRQLDHVVAPTPSKEIGAIDGHYVLEAGSLVREALFQPERVRFIICVSNIFIWAWLWPHELLTYTCSRHSKFCLIHLFFYMLDCVVCSCGGPLSLLTTQEDTDLSRSGNCLVDYYLGNGT